MVRGGGKEERTGWGHSIKRGMGGRKEGEDCGHGGMYAPWIGWKLAGLAVLRSRARSSDAKAFFWNAAASSGWRSREGPRLAPLRRLLFVLEEGIVGEERVGSGSWEWKLRVKEKGGRAVAMDWIERWKAC